MRSQLREAAWRLFSTVVPVLVAWVTGWAIWIQISNQIASNKMVDLTEAQTVSMRLSWRRLRMFLLAAVGLGVIAIIGLLITGG